VLSAMAMLTGYFACPSHRSITLKTCGLSLLKQSPEPSARLLTTL
jgi:hypothetical protein